MNRAYIQKSTGLALLGSGLFFLIFKLINLPESYAEMDAFVDYENTALWFFLALFGEILLTASRIALGFWLYNERSLVNWQFYLLSFFTALNDLTGIILVVILLACRYNQYKTRVNVT